MQAASFSWSIPPRSFGYVPSIWAATIMETSFAPAANHRHGGHDERRIISAYP
jgi:hypothetical protein